MHKVQVDRTKKNKKKIYNCEKIFFNTLIGKVTNKKKERKFGYNNYKLGLTGICRTLLSESIEYIFPNDIEHLAKLSLGKCFLFLGAQFESSLSHSLSPSSSSNSIKN